MRCGVQKRGSYFFVIDAFIAAIIISSTIVVLFSDYREEQNEREVFYAAEDLLVLLEGTEIRDFESDEVRAWIENGDINDSTRSVLEQLAFFNVTSRPAEAQQLATLVLNDVPVHVSARLIIDSEMYAESSLQSDADADVFFTSKRIILLRRVQTDLYPPVVIEVQTWQ